MPHNKKTHTKSVSGRVTDFKKLARKGATITVLRQFAADNEIGYVKCVKAALEKAKKTPGPATAKMLAAGAFQRPAA